MLKDSQQAQKKEQRGKSGGQMPQHQDNQEKSTNVKKKPNKNTYA